MTPPLQHVAIIMDGNRRWARAQDLDPVKGHEYAAKNAIEPIIEKCADLGIPFVTFWAFSTENWRRDEEELKGLFNVFRFALGSLALRFIKKGAKLRILGDINKFPKDIAQKTLEMMSKSAGNHKITVTFALNYGGRDEIVRAIKKIVSLFLLTNASVLKPHTKISFRDREFNFRQDTLPEFFIFFGHAQ